MILNTHTENRRIMTTAISELIGIPSVYMRAPTYSYQLGDITVHLDGAIESENVEELERIAPMLVERGWLDAIPDFEASVSEEAETLAPEESEAETTAPTSGEISAAEAAEPPDPTSPPTKEEGAARGKFAPTTVRIYEPSWEISGLRNLVRILYTRQYLINRMLRMDLLFIDEEVIQLLDDMNFLTVSDLRAMLTRESEAGMIRGFQVDADSVTLTTPYDCNGMYYAQLFTAICKQARGAKYTRAVKQEPENDKYMANSWLARLGFGGAEHRELRRTFMAHLNGYAAFRNDEKMREHRDRLAEQRRIKHELEEEESV